MEDIRLLEDGESTQENSDQITLTKDISLPEDEEFAQLVPVESSFEDENISNLQDNGNKRRSDVNNLNHENSGRVKRQRRSSIILKRSLCAKGNDVDKWFDTMNDKLDSINKNDVWELIDLLYQRKAIGCKWVLKKKLKADGSLDKYRARLVAKGFTQQPGVDFVDTYSSIAKFTSIRIIVSIIAKMDLELHQLDVKTTFLNGELKEDIYMVQPEGFNVNGHE